MRTDPAVAGSPPSVISQYGGYVPPVAERTFQNAGMRHYHHPRDGSPTRDTSKYTTTSLAAQEPMRQTWMEESPSRPRSAAPRMTNHGDRFYSDDHFYQQRQHEQHMRQPQSNQQRPPALYTPQESQRSETPPPSDRGAYGIARTPPDSERQRRHHHHQHTGGQPWLDGAVPSGGNAKRDGGNFKPPIRPGVPLEVSSQAYGLHVVHGDLNDTVGGGSSDRSFREIGVPSASYNDPFRRGVVVPGYAGHKPGEIERYGHAPTFVPPRNSSARSPDDSGGARLSRPTMTYQDMAQDKMPLPEDRTDAYLRAVGGVVPSYAGHVPKSQYHYGSKHLGGVSDPKMQSELAIDPAAGKAAQRDHAASKLDYYSHEPARDATMRAHLSLPGYGGHKRGDAEAFGSSYHSVGSPPILAVQNRGGHAAGRRGGWAEQPAAFASAAPWFKEQATVAAKVQPGRPPQRVVQERSSPGPAALRAPQGSPAGRPTISPPKGAQLGQRRPTGSPEKAHMPPAGLGYENAAHGLGLNLWEQATDEYSA